MGFYLHCRDCKLDWKPATECDLFCPRCGSDNNYHDLDKTAPENQPGGVNYVEPRDQST